MVSRARALLVAVPFFGSLAGIAFSLVHLGRWPMLFHQTRELDLEVVWTSVGPYAVQAVPELHRSAIASAWLAFAAVLLLATTLFALFSRSAAAPVPWVLASLLSAAWVALLLNPLLVVPVRYLIWFVTFGCAMALWLAMGATGRRLSPTSLVISVVALACLSIPLVDAARQPTGPGLMTAIPKSWWTAPPVMPEWPSWLWLMGFAACALGAGLLRVELGRNALWFVVPLALVLGRFAAASASDWSAMSRAHRGFSLSEGLNRQFPPARNCRSELQLAPMILVHDGEVLLSGTAVGTTGDAALVAQAAVEGLAALKPRFVDLSQQAGRDVVPSELNVLAETGTPLPIVVAIALAGATNGMRRVHFVTFRPPVERLRSFPAVHLHPCVVDVELADDGVPMSSFSDWPALLRAADDSSTVLRLSPR